MSARICIYGAGAIGGFLATRFAHAGYTVSCIARGDHLAAIRARGLRLIEAAQETLVQIECTDRPDSLGKQDFVFVTLKTHAVADSVEGIAALLGPSTVIVTAQNGLPWWYFHRDSSALAGQQLEAVDPAGLLWKTLGPERAIGAIVYPAASVAGPGVIRHLSGERFALGEPGGENTERIRTLQALMSGAGLQAPVSADIRREIWLKLSINAAINPLSLVRRATIGEIVHDGAGRAELVSLIREVQKVAESIGIEPLMSAADLVVALEPFAAHKTSMLTDYENHRPLELDGLSGAVLEIAGHMRVAAPELRRLYDRVRVID